MAADDVDHDDQTADPATASEMIATMCSQWSPLRQEPEAPYNNATSRGLRRITTGRSRGIASRGVQETWYSLVKNILMDFPFPVRKKIRPRGAWKATGFEPSGMKTLFT